MPVDKPSNEGYRSPSGLNAAAASLLCVMLSIYLALRHWHTVNVYGVFVIFVPLGIQIIGQFQRARGILNAMESAPITSRNAVFDMLFWAAIANLMLLVFITALLRRVDGFF
ncbi:MAG: hypothetical protein ABR955_16320 [Verrucomicrobiota bacterium]|jgi:hypothetical protein